MSTATRGRGVRISIVALTALALLVGGVPAEARRTALPAGEAVRRVVPSKIRVATWLEPNGCVTGAELWFTLAPGAMGYEWQYHDGGVLQSGFSPGSEDDAGYGGLPKGVGKRGIAALWGDANPCGGRKEAEDGYRERLKGPTKVVAVFPIGTGLIRGAVTVIDCHLGADKCKPAAKLMGARIVATRRGKRSTATSGVDGGYLMSVTPGSYELRPSPIPDWVWTQKARSATATKNGTTFVNFSVRIPPGGPPPPEDPGIKIKRPTPDELGLLGDTPCAGPDRGLVSCWRFERNLGDTVGDNDGSPVDGPSYATGAVGDALALSGWTAAVQVPDSDSLDMTGGRMTVSAWIFRTSGRNVQHLLGKRAGCDAGEFPWQVHEADGKTAFGSVVGGGLVFATADGIPPMWAWQHLVGTADGDAVRIYIDGELAGKQQGSLAAPDGSPLRIGGSGTCATFGGRMDEVQLWSRALTEDEVAGMYRANAPCGGRPDAPRRLTPGDGASIADTSPTLDWTAIGCATSYRLEVRQGTKTGRQVANRSGLKASEAAVELSAGKTFWWRASACNAAGCATGAWSSFKTIA